MILDTLAHANDYAALGGGYAKAFAFLRRQDLAQLKPGRYEIDGDAVYAMVMEVDLKPPEEGIWEAHRKYVDVQYVIHGTERMDVCDISLLKTSKAYDPQGDAELFTGKGKSLIVPAGTFAIFLPHDGHMPGLRGDGQPAKVKKAVVKVRY